VNHVIKVGPNCQNFIDSVNKVAGNSVVEGEQRILEIYEPAPLHESDSGPDDIPVVSAISYKTTLEGREILFLCRLQNPHVVTKRRAGGCCSILRETGC